MGGRVTHHVILSVDGFVSASRWQADLQGYKAPMEQNSSKKNATSKTWSFKVTCHLLMCVSPLRVEAQMETT